MKILIILFLFTPTCWADTTLDSDVWILGNAGVETTSPDGQLEVQADSTHPTVFRVSGVDETPFLIVGQDGKVGISTNPTAQLDVMGVADVSDIAIQLDAGDLDPNTSTYQMTLGYAGNESYRHAIRSRHKDSVAGNAVEFYLWNPGTGGATAIGDQKVLSLITTSTNASVHIMPVGTPEYELVVSNGDTTGGGTVSAASIVEPSSRRLKEGIRSLGKRERDQAFREVAGLKHKTYRYKKGSQRIRGLIFEESPPSIQAKGSSLSMNERIVNAELAMQALIERLEALGADHD